MFPPLARFYKFYSLPAAFRSVNAFSKLSRAFSTHKRFGRFGTSVSERFTFRVDWESNTTGADEEGLCVGGRAGAAQAFIVPLVGG